MKKYIYTYDYDNIENRFIFITYHKKFYFIQDYSPINIIFFNTTEYIKKWSIKHLQIQQYKNILDKLFCTDIVDNIIKYCY